MMPTPGQSQPQRGHDVWTIGRILQWTQSFFSEKGIASPRLDAELLLADVLGQNRVYLYTHYDQPLTQAERETYRERIRRRARREPCAYILGRKEFFGRPFHVTPAVLIPRPETEHVVEAALAWMKERELATPRILDVGTGSGTLGITLAAELPQAQVVATDISAEALAIARENAASLGVLERIELLEGDLYEPVATALAAGGFDVVVANPPYVDPALRDNLAPEIRDYEPAVSLFAAERGLAVIRRLAAGATGALRRPGLFACEIGADQAEAVLSLLRAHGPWTRLEVQTDLAHHPRVVVATRGEDEC